MWYNKLNMSERDHTSAEVVMLQAVRDEINMREEEIREGFLHDFFYHEHEMWNGDDLKEGERVEALAELRQNFLHEKEGKNMGEMFDLALNPAYLNRIHVVELGRTTKPGSNGEVDGLKHEYNDLKNWMIVQGIIEDELTRSASGRYFDITVPNTTRERIVLGRNRPLIDARLHHIRLADGKVGDVKIEIAKRMVFSVPTALYLAFVNKNDPHLVTEESKVAIEHLLQKRDKSIDSIRTAYYLRTQVISE